MNNKIEKLIKFLQDNGDELSAQLNSPDSAISFMLSHHPTGTQGLEGYVHHGTRITHEIVENGDVIIEEIK